MNDENELDWVVLWRNKIGWIVNNLKVDVEIKIRDDVTRDDIVRKIEK